MFQLQYEPLSSGKRIFFFYVMYTEKKYESDKDFNGPCAKQAHSFTSGEYDL